MTFFRFLTKEVHNSLLRGTPPSQEDGSFDGGLSAAAKHFDSVVHSPDHIENLKKLGIFVAGFIFVDPWTNEVEPLLFTPSVGSESLAFMTPYVWTNIPHESQDSKDLARVIDSQFRLWRVRDSLADADNNPEYFSCLPAGHEVSGGGIADRYGCHYVSLGESKFFLYCWRLILCVAQRDSWQTTNLSADHTARPHLERLWSAKLWSNIKSRESDWSRFLREHRKSVNGLSLRSYSRDDRVRKDFQRPEFSGRVDLPPWLSCLCQLNLVRVSGSTIRSRTGLQACLRYASSLVARRGLDRLATQLLESSYFSPGSEINSDSLRKLDSSLQAAVEVMTQSDAAAAAAPTAADRLAWLDKRCRFPLLPYYYWNALDGVDKTHLVVPVWEAFGEGNLVSYLSAQDPREPDAEPPRRVQTNITAVAVLGVEPLSETSSDWTLLEPGSSPKASLRLERTISYLRELARAPAHAFYYRRSEQANAFEQASTWAHDVKNFSYALVEHGEQALAAIRRSDTEEAARRIRSSTQGARILAGAAFSLQRHFLNRRYAKESEGGQNLPRPRSIELAEACFLFLLNYFSKVYDYSIEGENLQLDSRTAVKKIAAAMGHKMDFRRGHHRADRLAKKLFENEEVLTTISILREAVQNVRPRHPLDDRSIGFELRSATSEDARFRLEFTNTQLETVWEENQSTPEGINKVNSLFGPAGLGLAWVDWKDQSTNVQDYWHVRVTTTIDFL